MSRYQAYPKYKASGVEWLGDVPEHWEVIQIKHLSTVNRGASPRPIDDEKYFDDNGEYAWVRIADVSSSNGVLRETTQRLSELGNSLSVKIHEGDLFISIAGTVGKPCISAIKACIHDGFVYFPTLTIPPIFLYRIFEAGLCYGGLGKFGTQLNLNTETIGAIRIALPNSNLELTQVLDFLETQTAKIDTLIAKQQRMIALLGEKRQAVISHAVTKGLNPDAPMKDSGVAWLGDVPVHWETRRNRFIFKFSKGLTITKADLLEEGIPCINYGEIHSKYGFEFNPINNPLKCVSMDFIESSNECLLNEGNFVFADTSEDIEGSGNFSLLNKDERTFAGYHTIIAKAQADICSKFFAYVFDSNSFRTQIQTSVKGVKVFSISQAILKDASVWFPKLDEQTTIANFLDTQTAKIDTLISKAKSAITLLQERRSALISAAVTGKIDVRELA